MSGPPAPGRLRRTTLVGAVLAALSLAAGAASASPQRAALTTVTVDTLPIANALPLDLGIAKGFFAAHGIEIKKQTLQSGNDIVLALANHNGDVGYLGYTPMMIARTQGIPVTLVAASEVEGTSTADNWQNVLVKGSSSIRTPADLAGKTIAVNALKGVSEVVIRASLEKLGVDPNSVKLLAIPFPAMRTALNNGQVDAIHVPEPFLSQGLNLDGDRIVLAPGPVLGNFWPNGGYAALSDWIKANPATAKSFRLAINESLAYAQAHPDEIRAMLPPGTQNVRLPVWSPLIDRTKLLALAKYAKQFGVITSLPNFTQLFPSDIRTGFATGLLEATVGKTVRVLEGGKTAVRLDPGKYLLIVKDGSKTSGFRLEGPGVTASTPVGKTGTFRFAVTVRPGRYTFTSVGKGKASRGSFSSS
jgi:NitT/TauT family transport system substrate-binding protein